jgi:hypothetical protein
MTKLSDLSPDVLDAFKQTYFDLVHRENERTGADMALLEKAGLMRSRILTEDDDFFGIDSLEPGDRCYEFTRAGQALCDYVEKEHAAEIPTWGDGEE